jgi:uncharacterized protein (TIGR03790 family)
MRRLLSFVWALSCLLFLQDAIAATGRGDEVVVVYNSNLPGSKMVADYYAEKRNVPSAQVIGLPLSTNTDFSRAEFRDQLEWPLARAIREKGLWEITEVPGASAGAPAERKVTSSKIRYALLCYGVPFRIVADPTLREEGTEGWRAELRRNEASVDTDLALLPLLERKIILAGPLRNPLYGATNGALLHPTNGVLMVTRLDGPTAEIARGLVDKALEGEKWGLWGRAYIDIRNTTATNYIAGDEVLRKTAEICRRLGYETTVDTNGGTFPVGFPMSHIAFYAGWYDETVSGPFTLPKVEFMPGAFAYHLHSFSAASLRSPKHNWVGPLLAKGVTATMGTVNEPYLGGTPDMSTFAARFLYDAFTFGEAAYAAQSVLSWQATIVGDPLYRAVPRNADLLHAEFLRTGNKLAEWSLLRLANVNLASGRSAADVTLLLEDTPLRKQSAVLSEKLADLYAAAGKPSSASHAARQALELAESPQQKLRLRLTMADRLNVAGDYAGASEQLEAILKEMPDYADRKILYSRLARMAKAQGKTVEAESFESIANGL